MAIIRHHYTANKVTRKVLTISRMWETVEEAHTRSVVMICYATALKKKTWMSSEEGIVFPNKENTIGYQMPSG